MVFTERLNQLLREKHLTRKQFLDDLHFGKNQFTYWEKNQTVPNRSTLDGIATYFGVSTDYLLGNTDQKEKTTNLEEKGRQAEFVDLFSQLTPEQQKMLMAQMKGLLSE